MQNFLPLQPFLYIPSKVPPEGHGLHGLQGGRSPKRHDSIFSECIFLKVLDPYLVPKVILGTGHWEERT